jgi:hypothetical protein
VWSVNVSLVFFTVFLRGGGGGGGVFGLVLFVKIHFDGVFKCVSYMFVSGKIIWENLPNVLSNFY